MRASPDCRKRPSEALAQGRSLLPLDYRDPRQVEEWLPVPKAPRADEPREMSKADICNVEYINSSDLDPIFDGIIEAASFQHALEDCECRWNIVDVDHDLMDLSDRTLPKMQRDVAWQLTQRDVVPYRSKR